MSQLDMCKPSSMILPATADEVNRIVQVRHKRITKLNLIIKFWFSLLLSLSYKALI